MKIEVFKIESKEDEIYQELLEQYKTNPEVNELLNKPIISSELILAGDFRLIKMLNHAIKMDSINVYLVKDIDSNTFLWVIGKYIDSGKLNMFPLLKEQPKKLQLEIRKALKKKGVMKKRTWLDKTFKKWYQLIKSLL